MSYSSKVTIHRDLFEVISYGNGAAYSFGLAEDEEDARLFVQGDDATAFREEWTSVENAYPHLATDTIIRDIYTNWSAEG